MTQRADPVGPPASTGSVRPAAAAPALVGATGSVAKRSEPPISLQQQLTGWAFALPFVIIFLAFLAGPLLASLVLSLTDFGLRDLRNPLGVNFIGLANYAELLGDKTFHKALANTAFFVLVGVPLTLGVGLAVALALDRGIRRFRTMYRVGYYLPVVTSIVGIAVVWRFVLNPDYGLVNMTLGALGIEGPNWLGSQSLAMPSLIVMAAWRNLGFAMVLFLAGLQTIPVQLYEAASIDGAGRWAAFKSVTLPLLRPTMLFALVITTIGYIQVFEEPFVMTGGGPLDSTLSISMFMYQEGFEFFHQGYAAAIAWVLFLIVALIAVVQFRALRSET